MQISDPAALGKFVTSELSKISNSIDLANQQIAANGAVPVLGTAATKNVGVAAGNVVQLDVSTAKLPAVDGSLLTNLPTTALPVALKTDQQTGTSTTLAVTPAHAQDHDSAAKAWVTFTGSTGAILSSYNVSNVTRTAAGRWTITIGPTSFATVNYAFSGCCGPGAGAGAGRFLVGPYPAAPTVSSFQCAVVDTTFTFADSDYVSLTFFGRQ
jgi:hypothetical protein